MPQRRSASVRCGGCACRLPRWGGVERLNSAKPAATSRCAGTPSESDIAPPRSRAPRTLPVRLNCGLLRSGRTSVWPSTPQHPGDLRRICRSRSISAVASLSSSARPSGNSKACPVSKNTSTERQTRRRCGWSAGCQNGAQAPEEPPTVARQFLYPLRQRDRSAAGRDRRCGLRFLVALLDARATSSSAASWRRNAVICWFNTLDLRQRARRDHLFRIQRPCSVRWRGRRRVAGPARPS